MTRGFKPSERLAGLSGYAFAEVDRRVAALKEKGIAPIDFGVGDPGEPTPEVVRAALKAAADSRAASGYPNYAGSPEFREAVAAWTERRFGLRLDPTSEISATIGSKEAVFNFPEAVVDPGDFVICPNPGYPPYERGARFAEGRVHHVDLLAENGFLPDLSSIPAEVIRRAKIIWINYPNNPTGAVAPRAFFEEVVRFGQRHGIIVASDEAYTENHYGEPPPSILEFAREGVVAFQSLSKRSLMTCYRVGWMAGDAGIIAAFKKLKTNIDSGTPTFIQDAAIAALSDESHVEALRSLYSQKRDIMVEGLKAAGLEECRPAATLYIWQRVPKGQGSLEFAERLLEPDAAIVTTPGKWLGHPTDRGNPAEGYIRLALVPPIEDCVKAAERIRGLKIR